MCGCGGIHWSTEIPPVTKTKKSSLLQKLPTAIDSFIRGGILSLFEQTVIYEWGIVIQSDSFSVAKTLNTIVPWQYCTGEDAGLIDKEEFFNP